ncbi:transcription cofactor vestigial-like protein 4 [Brienomyrus brachyistius]|uniref:transcription cofactor vestigial-like protein 4 n=1 Tax=Brienomyrus brachyistius TaxID=42636 RepID=UPI0020B19216|nr:transcription cofactor vestigial-like protein 4 [Brienomyrus brachyistius]
MLLTTMDLLNYQYMDKMNNNIGLLCYEGEDLRGELRMQSMSAFISSHRTGPPPISPGKRKYSGDQLNDNAESEHVSKMSRLFAAQIDKTISGQYRQDRRDQSGSPGERGSIPTVRLHGSLIYSPMPILAMEQPLALTKNSVDATSTLSVSPAASPVERQQNRPSVITCASANNRNCNLSHCPLSHRGCVSSYRKPAGLDTPCDPVIEEHFRRSLGRNYKEPELVNSVSITGSVDDHFAKALGEAWLQIKAKGSVSGPAETPGHGFDNARNHSPSMVS